MSHLSSCFTLLPAFLLLTACGAKSTGAAGPILPGIAGNPNALVATPNSASIAPGASTTVSVIGGTAPYNWTVASGGGSLSASTGMTVTYTAGSTPGLAYLSVSDSAGNSTTTNINISGAGSTAGNVCQGNYSVTLSGQAAAAQLATDSSGGLTGAIIYAGHTYPLQGTCTTSGVSFTLVETGDTFTGTFLTNSGGASRAAISGTYHNVNTGTNPSWVATPL